MGVKDGAAYGLGAAFGLASFYASGYNGADLAADPSMVSTVAAAHQYATVLEAYGINVAGDVVVFDDALVYDNIYSGRVGAYNTLVPYGLNVVYYLGMYLAIAEGQASHGATQEQQIAMHEALTCGQELLSTYPFVTTQAFSASSYSGISTLRQVYQQDFKSWNEYVGVNTQNDWRYCSKCHGLIFGGINDGLCPAGGEAAVHNTTGSWNYSLIMNVPYLPGQHLWNHCDKCQALFFSAAGASVCPGLGDHDGGGSGDYILLNTGAGQPDWQYCQLCKGLFWAGDGNGVCPASSSGHNASGSGGYDLTYQTS